MDASGIDISELLALTSRRWNIPVLAVLGAGGPARAWPVSQAIGASKGAVATSLLDLMAQGLIQRNAGHGHPLRPEIQLTRRGKERAELASQVWELACDDPAQKKAAFSRWALATLVLAQAKTSFGDLRAQLPGITDRALSLGLRALVDCGLLQHRFDTSQRPPASLYWTHGKGTKLARLAACLGG